MKNFFKMTFKEIWTSTIQFFVLLFLGIAFRQNSNQDTQLFLTTKTVYIFVLIIAFAILTYHIFKSIKKYTKIKNIITSAWTQKLHENPQTSQLGQRDFRQRLYEEMIDDICKNKLREIGRNEIEKIAEELLIGVDKGYSNQIL